MVFDVHRLIFKTFRILIAQAMRPDFKKFSNFLSESRNQQELKFLEQSQTWKEETQWLKLFLVFVKETLKFLLLSFFKQCRIILKILDKFHEMRRDRDDQRSSHETKESILADMLARNLKWAILTILTCIPEEREDYDMQMA